MHARTRGAKDLIHPSTGHHISGVNSLNVELAIIGKYGREHVCATAAPSDQHPSRRPFARAWRRLLKNSCVAEMFPIAGVFRVRDQRRCARGVWYLPCGTSPRQIGAQWLRFDEFSVRSISRNSPDGHSTMRWRLPNGTNRRSRCFTYQRAHRSSCTRRVRLQCRRQCSPVTIGIGCSPP